MGAALQDDEEIRSFSHKNIVKLKLGSKSNRDGVAFERWKDAIEAAVGDEAARTITATPPPFERWVTQSISKGSDAELAEAYQVSRKKFDRNSRRVANFITNAIDFSDDTLGTYATDLRKLQTAKQKMNYLIKKCMDVSSEKAQGSLIEHFNGVIIIPAQPDQQLMESVLMNIKYAFKIWLRIEGNSGDRIHLFRRHVLKALKTAGGKAADFADKLESTSELLRGNKEFDKKMGDGEKFAEWVAGVFPYGNAVVNDNGTTGNVHVLDPSPIVPTSSTSTTTINKAVTEAVQAALAGK